MGNQDDLIAGTDADDGEDVLAGDTVTPKVIAIVSDVLRLPKDAIGPETAAADVEGWDSFGHVRIVLAIDQAFGVKLSMGAIERADSVAGLVEAVEDALAES